jgi:hypothetical protein
MSDDSIAELSAALAKAQGAFAPVTKSKTAQVRSDKGNYSYTYSTLDELIAATRPALSANGLACIQHARTDGQRVVVVTELLHTSGQRLAFPEIMIALPAGGTPQSIGSALTYARRYSLSASLGVAAEEDDDGQGTAGALGTAAAGTGADRRQTTTADKAEPRKAEKKQATKPTPAGVISDAQRTRLYTIASTQHWSTEDTKALLKRFGFDSSKDVTVDKYDAIVAAIETGEAVP